MHVVHVHHDVSVPVLIFVQKEALDHLNIFL